MNWNKNKYKIASIGILAVVFIYILYMGLNALWMGDDLLYQSSFATGGNISNLNDIWHSQVAHYFCQNGRFVAHYLVQIFLCLLPQYVFAIVNAVIFIAFILLMLAALKIDFGKTKSVAVIAMLAILCFQTKFTPTCQIGYIWMFSLIISWALLFQRFADTCSKWNILWLMPLSLIAGWSQEALVIGVGAALAWWWFGHLKSMTMSQWAMLVAFGTGALALCLSPANINRTGSETGSVDFLSSGAYSIVKLLYYSRASYLLVGLCLYLLISKKANIKDLFTAVPYLWIIWTVLLAFNIVIGIFGNRQIFGCELAALFITVILFRSYSHAAPWVETLIVLLFLALIIPKAIFNERFLANDRAVLQHLQRIEKMSADGIAYYDFSAAEVTFKDTYPSDAYSWHVLKTLNLEVLPEVCKDLDRIQVLSIKKPARGNITAVCPGDSGHSISIRRYIKLFGKEFTLNISPLESFHPAFIEGGKTVYVIYNKVPFTKMVAEKE